MWLKGIAQQQTSWEVTQMLICGFEFGNGRFQKDTADGEADLKYGGDNAEWVEDPLVPGQSTPPGQLSEHDGVKTDACEAEGST